MGQQPAPNSATDQAGSADRSVTEWVLLALLVEAPAHGFALAKALEPESDLGRILTVRRPLVYRALDRLAAASLVEPLQTEPGDAGPTRTVFQPTAFGLAELERWLAEPVIHVRDLRLTFLVKLRLFERLGQNSEFLIAAQRVALDHKIERLISADGDVVDLWRSHNARAARDFLDEVEAGAGG
ncbi:MAG: PadR family transcriptional regulator [Acidimicrobiales bacterium]